MDITSTTKLQEKIKNNELESIIASQDTTISNQATTISNLENQIANILSRLNALENP